MIGLLACLIVPAGCTPPEKEKPVEAKPRTVNIMPVTQRDVPIVVNEVGRLAPNREVVLSAQVSGIVRTYSVDMGTFATADMMLVTLDQRDYRLALNESRANLLAARARYTAALNSYNRAEQLLPENVVTQEYFDKIEADYKAAQAAVSQAQAVVDINQRRLEKTAIGAPFDGLVTRRMVELGQNINIGDPVIAMADMALMRVKIYVNEQDYVHVDKDDAVSIVVEAYPDRTFPGEVDRIGVKADPRTNTFEVEILVDNPDLVLKDGLTAAVRITVDEIKDAIMIPQGCVLFRENRKEVFVLTDADRAAAREVKMGRVDGSSVRILEGLAPGDRLVITGSQYLKDGDRVVVAAAQ
jgi:RND family efflux transporter MFP subunit